MTVSSLIRVMSNRKPHLTKIYEQLLHNKKLLLNHKVELK